MGEVLAYIVVAVLVGLLLLAIVSLLRSFLLSIRAGRGEAPPVRIARAYRPGPVVATRGVTVVGCAAIVWALVHLALVALWAATGGVVPLRVSTGVAAAYVCIAAGLTGAGGLLMLFRRASGRRTIAWGEFLLGMASVLGVAIALMLPGYEEVEKLLRQTAWALAGALAIHLVVDVIIGTAAQRAGKSARPMDDTQTAEEATPR